MKSQIVSEVSSSYRAVTVTTDKKRLGTAELHQKLVVVWTVISFATVNSDHFLFLPLLSPLV